MKRQFNTVLSDDTSDLAAFDNLPVGWILTRLGELTTRSEYGTSTKCDFGGTSTPVLRIPNIVRGEIDTSDLKRAIADMPLDEGDELQLGDMLICRTNGSLSLLGKTAVIILSTLHSMPLPLAPLNEQRRIVAKIEELFSDLVAGVAALTRANLKRYRASVLKAAVEGALTAEWRIKNVEAASRRLPEDTASKPTPGQATGTRQDAASTAGEDVGYFDPQQPVANLQGNLPHWRQEHVTYFVTFRLADSIPAATLELWKRERDDWLARNPEPHSPAQKREYEQQFVNRFHKWLDAGHGECHLGRPDVRQIVTQALLHFQNSRYLLREWVVMPNHLHVIVAPLPGHNLSDILHSWKSFTAKKINKLLGKTGTFWQKESFDHIVRGPDQLERIERYIHNNPQSLPIDRYTLGCIHDVEVTSRRLPEAPQSDSTEDEKRGVSEAGAERRTRQDAASTSGVKPARSLLARIKTDAISPGRNQKKGVSKS